ncbi:hypothetical protein SCALM49S_03480 [Streptomyces californicus]
MVGRGSVRGAGPGRPAVGGAVREVGRGRGARRRVGGPTPVSRRFGGRGGCGGRTGAGRRRRAGAPPRRPRSRPPTRARSGRVRAAGGPVRRGAGGRGPRGGPDRGAGSGRGAASDRFRGPWVRGPWHRGPWHRGPRVRCPGRCRYWYRGPSRGSAPGPLRSGAGLSEWSGPPERCGEGLSGCPLPHAGASGRVGRSVRGASGSRVLPVVPSAMTKGYSPESPTHSPSSRPPPLALSWWRRWTTATWAVTGPGAASGVKAVRTHTETVSPAGTVNPRNGSPGSPRPSSSAPFGASSPPKTPICSSRSVVSQATRCTVPARPGPENSVRICSAVSRRSRSVRTRTGCRARQVASVVLVRSRTQERCPPPAGYRSGASRNRTATGNSLASGSPQPGCSSTASAASGDTPAAPVAAAATDPAAGSDGAGAPGRAAACGPLRSAAGTVIPAARPRAATVRTSRSRAEGGGGIGASPFTALADDRGGGSGGDLRGHHARAYSKSRHADMTHKITRLQRPSRAEAPPATGTWLTRSSRADAPFPYRHVADTPLPYRHGAGHHPSRTATGSARPSPTATWPPRLSRTDAARPTPPPPPARTPAPAPVGPRPPPPGGRRPGPP